MRVPIPEDVDVRLRALQQHAEGLPVALLELRLRAQQQVVQGRPVDLGTLDRVLVAVELLREELGDGARGATSTQGSAR